MHIKDIEARLAAIAEELRSSEDTLTTERIAELNAEVDTLKAERAAHVEAAEKRNALLDSIAAGKAETRSIETFGKEPEVEDRFATTEYRKAFMEYVLRGKAIPTEYRDASSVTTADAAAVIPSTVLNQIVDELSKVGNILALVTRTNYKGGMQIPVADFAVTAQWVKERAASDLNDGTVKDYVTFTYHKLQCRIGVSLEVDTMSLSAFEEFITRRIAEAMTKAIEAAIISGTGEGQPNGIINTEVDDDRIVSTSEMDYAALVNVLAAVPAAYESGSVWCMSKKTFMAALAMTDANGQPIARVNYGIAGKPERSILGCTVELYDDLPAIGTASEGEVVAFMFNFKNYVLNTNLEVALKRYVDNETDDVITKSTMLVDGKVVDGHGLVLLKKANAAG